MTAYQDPCDFDGDCYHEFQLVWDGRSDGGVLQPPNTYRAYGYLVDTEGQTLKVDLGRVVVQKLVTKSLTTDRQHPIDDHIRVPAYDVIGACSRVRGVTGLVLESMVLPCPTPAPGDDRVWLGIQNRISATGGLILSDRSFNRLVKVRLQVYGEPTDPGSVLKASVQNSLGRSDNTFVPLPGQLAGPVGWHPTGWLIVDPAVLGTRVDPAFRLQVDEASTYHVRFLRADYVYRAWANP